MRAFVFNYAKSGFPHGTAHMITILMCISTSIWDYGDIIQSSPSGYTQVRINVRLNLNIEISYDLNIILRKTSSV